MDNKRERDAEASCNASTQEEEENEEDKVFNEMLLNGRKTFPRYVQMQTNSFG